MIDEEFPTTAAPPARRSRLHRALGLVFGAAIAVVVAFCLFILMTSAARAACELSTAVACGGEPGARADYTGNAVSGTCRVDCLGRPSDSP